MLIKPNDIKIEYYKSSGPGGQRRNKKETAVRITHLATGIMAVSADERSQVRNKLIALKRLEKKLWILFRKKKKRLSTKRPVRVKEMILQEKKIKGEIKRLRAPVKSRGYE